MLRREAIPSLLIILMGTLDCVTTILGVAYAGAKELNPAMAVIVNSNVGAFLVVKIAATIFIALTYVFARKILHAPTQQKRQNLPLLKPSPLIRLRRPRMLPRLRRRKQPHHPHKINRQPAFFCGAAFSA